MLSGFVFGAADFQKLLQQLLILPVHRQLLVGIGQAVIRGARARGQIEFAAPEFLEYDGGLRGGSLPALPVFA